MTTIRKTLPTSWHASGRITAAGDTDVLVENTSDRDSEPRTRAFYWAMTDGDTAPTFAVHLGHQVEAGEALSLVVPDTRRLWLAARATLEVTQTVEA